MAEKGTLGLVGAEKFCVELVPLFHNGKGKRRDGLVGNKGGCERVAFVATSIIVEVEVVVTTSTIVEVVVLVLTQASLAMPFITLFSCRWNNASEKRKSTKK